MKLRTVALWAAFGVVASSAAATAIPLARSTHGDPLEVRPEPKAKTDLSHFSAGQTLLVDGRLGHATMALGGAGETYFFASVTGNGPADATAPPLNLAIVIDRSGSMKGDRIANALAAATGMVDRMREGDSVTIVSFDTEATLVVPPTLTKASTRASIDAAIRSIRLGGDTCISCGLEEGMRQLAQTALGPERVNRMILLSDGATNHGVRDLPGLRSMAGRMRDRGTTISTIGVDLDFDEKVMTSLAAEANGQHYFVASPSGLGAVFSREFDDLLASVASDAELSIELPPGVEVDQVFDRTFRREGTKILVPFGTFSTKEEKTVLMKLRVPSGAEGVQPVVDVKLTYRDLANKSVGTCAGSLAVIVTPDTGAAQKDLDPYVATRLERSRTAATLSEVNSLFEAGQVAAALQRLKQQTDNLDRTEALARRAPKRPAPQNTRGLDEDLQQQRTAVQHASNYFDPAKGPAPAATTSAGKATRKENEAEKFDLWK
jgi:Ca-activated chloride channel homolog